MEITVVNQSNINGIMAAVCNGEFVRIRFVNAYLEKAFRKMAVRSEQRVVVVADATTENAWVAYSI